jgi:hypothetical protein
MATGLLQLAGSYRPLGAKPYDALLMKCQPHSVTGSHSQVDTDHSSLCVYA